MIVRVALSLPLHRTFSYSVPARWMSLVKRFSRVNVPFGTGTRTGFIADIAENNEEGLKEIDEVVDLFPLVEPMHASLCEWAAHHYITPIGLVLKYAIPRITDLERYLVVSYRSGNRPGLQSIPLKHALTQSGPWALLRSYEDGIVDCPDIFTSKPFRPLPDQPAAPIEKILYVAPIEERMRYYDHLLSEQLTRGNNVLMLLPDYHTVGKHFERALAKSFQGCLRWFGGSTAVRARMETYFRARHEEGLIILGNKSAAFLPVRNNTLIIVERQEEDEYRNEESFRFNAATVAFQRAVIAGSSIVFGTVAPSLEMIKTTEDLGFQTIEKRAPKPIKTSEVIIERTAPSNGPLPAPLTELIETAVSYGEHIAIYTPRKDYASHIQCLECRRFFLCPLCGGMLSYRKQKDALYCSACVKTFEYHEACTHCGSSLIQFSQIGAEYLEHHIKAMATGAEVVKITGETPKKALTVIRGISERSPAVIIGTQILSKLYNFTAKKLALIGWEELLRMGGYRAEEKMFQILTNMLDALKPEELHVIMERKKKVDTSYFLDTARFYQKELQNRKQAEFPPYTRIFLIEIKKGTEQAGMKAVERVKRIMEEKGLTGFVTGPLTQKRATFLWRLILKDTDDGLSETLFSLYNIPDVRIEVDPLYI